MSKGRSGQTLSLCILLLVTTARASLTFNGGTQIATPAGNLVANHSFETAAPAPGFANQVYWATGTTNTPFAVPPAWTSTGAVNTYALWGSDGVTGQGINFSAPVPHGQSALYFGNGLTTVSPAPSFQPDGRVTFPLPPTLTPAFGAPCTLSQIINTPATPAPSYVLNFWVSGEEAVNPSAPASTWGEGIFGLRLTNVLPGDPIQYLSVPSFTSANPSRRFEYFFSPLNPLLPVQLEFINWGHLGTSTPTTTELVMDDVIVNAIPEPATPCALLLLCALAQHRARRRAHH